MSIYDLADPLHVLFDDWQLEAEVEVESLLIKFSSVHITTLEELLNIF